MECVNFSEKSRKAQLKKIILSFYYSEKYTKQNDYCAYKLFRIWTFIDCVREFLIFDAIEHIVDYLIPICITKDETICFNHMKRFDCLNFKVECLTKVPNYKNITSLLYIDIGTPLRIVSMYKIPTHYGHACVVVLSNGFFKIRCWLPKSAVEEVSREIKNKNPYSYNFSVNKVYIRIKGIKEYKGKRYVVIDCKIGS